MKGFTLIELIVVMGVLAVMFGLVTINVIKPLRSSSTNSAVSLLLSDLKQQQIKAMVGENGAAGAASASGIFFGSASYVMFQGSDYVSADANNFTINLGGNLTFSNITFPNAVVVFASGSGEVVGFIDGANSVRVGSLDGSDTKTIYLNRYGVVTQVN